MCHPADPCMHGSDRAAHVRLDRVRMRTRARRCMRRPGHRVNIFVTKGATGRDRLSDLNRRFSEKSVDAVDGDGVRYQIKGRRLTARNRSRQLGTLRDIDQEPFDVLLAVFFDEDLDVREIWSIPCEVVRKAAFVARTNSTRFVVTESVRRDSRVRRLA